MYSYNDSNFTPQKPVSSKLASVFLITNNSAESK